MKCHILTILLCPQFASWWHIMHFLHKNCSEKLQLYSHIKTPLNATLYTLYIHIYNIEIQKSRWHVIRWQILKADMEWYINSMYHVAHVPNRFTELIFWDYFCATDWSVYYTCSLVSCCFAESPFCCGWVRELSSPASITSLSTAHVWEHIHINIQ